MSMTENVTYGERAMRERTPPAKTPKRKPFVGFSVRLQTIMDAQGLTQLSLSHLMKTDQSAISGYVSGREPRASAVVALSKALRVPTDVLLDPLDRIPKGDTCSARWPVFYELEFERASPEAQQDFTKSGEAVSGDTRSTDEWRSFFRKLASRHGANTAHPRDNPKAAPSKKRAR